MSKKCSVLIAVLLVFCLVSFGCSPKDQAGNETGDKLSPKHGGILRIAIDATTTLDPTFLTTSGDNQAASMWNDYLVFCDEQGRPDPERSLAESWEYDEAEKAWTFKLRKGVLFHDGKEMTSRDVKFTFDRLRDPDVGAKTVDLFSNIVDITTPDEYTVVFKLKETNPEFLLDLADRAILDADNPDLKTKANGVGPFIIESYNPEDRIVLKRNPNYWRKDADGNPLPYLDGLELIVIPDKTAALEALRSGQVDFMYEPPSESLALFEKEPDLTLYTKPSATHYPIRMRADVAPFNDVRVRQALKLATDRQEMLEAAFDGFGVIGLDTPISPAYGDYYLDAPAPKRDVEKAKQLLAEAGYADGLKLTIYSPEVRPHSAMAVIWKEQLSEIGVDLDIQLVPSDIYYVNWLDYELGITDWGTRAHPGVFLQQAYITGARWNETHWSDSELDDLAAKIATEMDYNKRIEMYHRVQEIFMERGPIIVPAFKHSAWASRKDVKGVKPHIIEVSVDFSTVYLERE
ncbi:MAG TPA: ABC transporter substrate-binding protein [Syntrophaceticus sp.]|nr:ABC transporter substrate-binding protein [Syntrophaceticus sp.]